MAARFRDRCCAVNHAFSAAALRLAGSRDGTPMTHFEVHRFADDRWVLDAVFDDRAAALDDARIMLARARSHLAVRVLKVEERRSGFVEWVIYDRETGHADDRHAWRRAAALRAARRLSALPRSIIFRARDFAGGRGTSGHPFPALLTALLVLAGILIMFAHLPRQPHDSTWVFDRPEAQLPHAVRNPLTGEYSH